MTRELANMSASSFSISVSKDGTANIFASSL